MIRDACGDSRGDPEGLVNPDEVVMDEVNGESVYVFSIFLLKAFVRRVKRRRDMRMVRLCLSTMDVEMWSGSGDPSILLRSAATILAEL